jgi:hypothetical protein
MEKLFFNYYKFTNDTSYEKEWVLCMHHLSKDIFLSDSVMTDGISKIKLYTKDQEVVYVIDDNSVFRQNKNSQLEYPLNIKMIKVTNVSKSSSLVDSIFLEINKSNIDKEYIYFFKDYDYLVQHKYGISD